MNCARRVKIGTFAAASNITGALAPVDTVTALLHRHGALSFWDYATAAPYCSVDMNPVIVGEDRALVYKDAIFVSPHKFVGGPNTPGLLIAKKSLFSAKEAPAVPGGGTVFYVTENDHRYLSNREEREEGGTPDIVGSVRAGLVFHLKQQVGAFIERREAALWKKARGFVCRIWDCASRGYPAPAYPILFGRCGGSSCTTTTCVPCSMIVVSRAAEVVVRTVLATSSWNVREVTRAFEGLLIRRNFCALDSRD